MININLQKLSKSFLFSAMENYTEIHMVAQGKYFEVYKGYINKTGEDVAIKKPKKKEGKEALTKEIKAFKQLKPHENIIRILDCKYHDYS